MHISYIILNLPQTVTQGEAVKATYGWFADGTKYSVQDAQGNGYCYIGSLIYSTTAGAAVLESTDFSGGRIVLSGNTQTIHYHHKDHLGSVRAITDGSGSTIEQNAYYPFGGRHTFGQTYAQTTANRYKFNGKELQTTGNLSLLDYGARMYDTKIGRWLVQDPLAEKLYSVTPYRFSLNNPIIYTDYEGLFETRKEAREYRRKNDNVAGRISKNHDGSFSIIDNKNSIVYTKVSSELNSTDGDLIEKAILVTPYTNNENSIIQAIYDAQSAFINNPLVSNIASILATMMLPEFSIAYKSFVPVKSSVTKSSLKYGQYMHKIYHEGEIGKEYRLPSGKRIDFLDFKKHIIHELKPNNPNAIKKGHKQVLKYKEELEQIPEYKGIKWKTKLDTY